MKVAVSILQILTDQDPLREKSHFQLKDKGKTRKKTGMTVEYQINVRAYRFLIPEKS